MYISHSHRQRLVAIVVLIMMTASCADASTASATATVDSTTSAAPTSATALPTATLVSLPTQSPATLLPQPTATPVPAINAQLNQGVTLNLNSVAAKARGQLAPATINKRSYIDLDAVPEHLRVLFDEDAEPKAFDPRTRQLLILPIAEYGKLFGATTSQQFNDALVKLQAALKTPSLVAQRELTLLPTSGLQHALAAQVRPLSFNGGSGVRFVTQFTQEITPVTSSSLTYVFQGMTSDGAYFVAGYFPIASSAVSSDASQVTKDERDRFKKDYNAYIISAVQTLDTNEQSFTPAMAALDGMLTSLTISANPLAKPTTAGGSPNAKSTSPVAVMQGRAVELLNIRNAPSTRGRILGQLDTGEAATLTGRTADTQWIRVRNASGLVGWVSRQYLDTSANLNTLPVSQ